MENASEFLTQLINENTTKIFNKKDLWDRNHQLTFTKIEQVQGRFGLQWKVSLTNETTKEKGIIFFPCTSEGRNAVLLGLQKKINEIGSFPNIALKGRIMEEGTDLKPATISYSFAVWAPIQG